MEINTYSDLVNEIRNLRNEQNHLNDVQRQLDESNLDAEQRRREQQSITDHTRNTTRRLNELLAMQNAYNIMLENIRALRNIDVENAPDRQVAEEWVEELSDAIIEARTHLPESLQQEIRDRVQMTEEEFEEIVPENEQNVEPVRTQTVQPQTQAQTEPVQTIQQNTTQQVPVNPTPVRAAANTNVPRRNYANEYQRLEVEFDLVLSDRDLSEVGLEELETVSKKYTDIKERKQRLIEDIEKEIRNNDNIDIEALRQLLNRNEAFTSKIEKGLSDIEVITEEKEAIKEQLEDQIKELEDKIKLTHEQINDIEDKINQLMGNPLNQPQIDRYREIATQLQGTIKNDEDKIRELKDDIKILMKGGKLNIKELSDMKVDEITPIVVPEATAVEEKSKEEKPKESPKPEEKPKEKGEEKPEEKREQNAPVGPHTGPARREGAPAGPTPAVAPELPNTLENLIKKGELPNNFTPEELLDICAALNINVKDMKTIISKEHLDRLKNDHQIQTAMINQRIYERNKKKISEYDKLIAKYETILNDKMNRGSFSDEYIAKVEALHAKLKEEKTKLELKNMSITAFERKEVVKGTSHLSDESLDAKAMNQNEKIRQQYEKLDELRREKAEASSKFKQRKQDKRIEKVLKRIEKLKDKKSVIVSKQTQIVNENSDKYIERMTSKIQKQVARQERIEQNVEVINEISSRIEQSNAERQRIAEDRKKETRLFDKIGMAIEDRRLESQLSSLENQRDFQDFVGRHR